MDAYHLIDRLGEHSFSDRLREALIMVAEEVVVTGNPGNVQVTFQIEHPKGADQLVVVVTDTIKRNPPKGDSHGAMFYSLNGDFHTSDPRQPNMDFRVVDTPESEVRPADAGDAAVREAND